MKILCTWVGAQDIKATGDESGVSPGPIYSALKARHFDRVLVMNNYSAEDAAAYVDWLKTRSSAEIELVNIGLPNPTDLAAIYKGVTGTLKKCLAECDEIPDLTFHLSPGTWAMATVWTLLSKTRFPAELIQSSKEAGVQTVDLPFDIYAELVAPADKRLVQFSQGSETWGDLEFRSAGMTRLLQKAGKASKRTVPVLIQGEAGTEKASLARMIHDNGPRKNGSFKTVNCSLLSGGGQGTLFGPAAHTQGAGIVEAAAKGTLYLEEIEALSIEEQARLEAFLETGINPDARGSGGEPLDVRVIVSTGSDLLEAVTGGRFRESLFYALAVLILKLPPLRERSGDLGPLIDGLMGHINEQNKNESDFVPKTLSPAARSVLMQRSWPGNVRELKNTLMRACVWSDNEQITEAEILDSIFALPAEGRTENDILGRPIVDGVEIQGLLDEVSRHYIGRAIEHAEGNKTVAAALLGLPSYQTLTNWMKRYDVG